MEAASSSFGVVVPNLSRFMSIKLDRTNFPLWLAQIVPILKSKNLMGFVTGRTLCPLEFKCDTDGNATTEINLAYVTWYQQDQMILNWINNSLSALVLSIVARFTSSQATWSSLEKSMLSIKKSHFAINLALAGKPIDDDELVTIIMNNVGPAYEVTVSSAQARDTPISYDDLVALLLKAEISMRLKAKNMPSLETNPTAMYAPKSTHHSTRGRGSLSHRGSPMRGRGSSSAHHSWTSPTSGSQNYGSAGSSKSHPPCQIYNRQATVPLIVSNG
uniref:Retrotransposon Copia-like N-terminal domain-containing protein n=1 Tax=Fagus sylvatica TaxID=28930 RepID=A0A2N9HM32_FAGSY